MTWQIGLTMIGIIFYFGISFDVLMRRDFEISFLNPIRNYKEWEELNWFGIGVITMLLNIICLPYAIVYWICKFVYWLFTVGR